MNNKGFTLVEVIAMMVVLAILMAITVPNITGILNNNKMNIIKSDAKKMVETAKVKTATNKRITKPGSGECLVFALNYLNDNQDINAGPNGGEYDQYKSFVIMTRSTTEKKYVYYVRLVENVENNKHSGINLINIEQVVESNSDYIGTITNEEEFDLNGDEDNDKAKLSSSSLLTGAEYCPSGIKAYYPGYATPNM